jgi:hypothetical protein
MARKPGLTPEVVAKGPVRHLALQNDRGWPLTHQLCACSVAIVGAICAAGVVVLGPGESHGSRRTLSAVILSGFPVVSFPFALAASPQAGLQSKVFSWP